MSHEYESPSLTLAPVINNNNNNNNNNNYYDYNDHHIKVVIDKGAGQVDFLLFKLKFTSYSNYYLIIINIKTSKYKLLQHKYLEATKTITKNKSIYLKSI